MRRLGPRPLARAIDSVLGDAQPPGLLPRVQAAWPEVAGEALAAAAEPVAERDGVVTVSCESAVWAQELELLAADLRERLDERLGEGALRRLRFVVGSAPNRR